MPGKGPHRTLSATYAYDGDGLLRSRTLARGRDQGPAAQSASDAEAATTSFVWDSSTSPAPLLAAGRVRVVQGLGPLYLVRRDGRTVTLVRDALGSVRAETNSEGAVTKAFRYQAYGAIAQRLPTSASPTLLGFAGELADPTGLIYLRARWYDPTTGRFTSFDPEAGAAARPGSLNGFTYAQGRPSLFTDPSGRCLMVCTAIIGLVVGAVVGGGSYAIHQAATGQAIDPVKFAENAAVGAAEGAFVGAFLGTTSFVGGAAVGGAAGAVADFVSQRINGGSVNVGEVIGAGVGGAVGGTIAGGALSDLGLEAQRSGVLLGTLSVNAGQLGLAGALAGWALGGGMSTQPPGTSSEPADTGPGYVLGYNGHGK